MTLAMDSGVPKGRNRSANTADARRTGFLLEAGPDKAEMRSELQLSCLYQLHRAMPESRLTQRVDLIPTRDEVDLLCCGGFTFFTIFSRGTSLAAPCISTTAVRSRGRRGLSECEAKDFSNEKRFQTLCRSSALLRAVDAARCSCSRRGHLDSADSSWLDFYAVDHVSGERGMTMYFWSTRAQTPRPITDLRFPRRVA